MNIHTQEPTSATRASEYATNDALSKAQSLLDDLPPELVQRLNEKLAQISHYRPRIGVLGKTGAGKSSLCNALFGQEIAAVNDVAACTRAPQDILLALGEGQNLTLVDLPGVGESAERDEEYRDLYEAVLPKLDMVLWVLRADERAYSVDEAFYHDVIKPHLVGGVPLLFVLSQADKIEPLREWQEAAHAPGPRQEENLRARVDYVAERFGVARSRIIPVSAREDWQLARLVEEMVFALPDEKKLSVARRVNPKKLTRKAREEVERSVRNIVADTLKGAATGAMLGKKLAGPIGSLVGAIAGGFLGAFGLL